MMNIFLFLCIAFLFTFLAGRLIERIRVPWIFAALIFGFLLAIYNPFSFVTSSSAFTFLAQLGMYFLLFVIGFELDLNKLKEQGGFILKSTLFIIFLEAFFGTLLVHFVFGYEWLISFVVALSFATVGEAVLIPILDEFKVVNTKLGQGIIGIGALDDMIEIFVLILVMFLVGSSASVNHLNTALILVSLFALFGLAFGLTKLKKSGAKFGFLSIENLFLFVLFVLFLFLGVGEYANATAIAALLSGIALKTFIPGERLKLIESEVKTMCYGFFAPLFFVWVGVAMDISYLVSYPLLILLVVAVSNGAKILGSLIVGRKELGIKKSVLLGVGLSVRFSTSIIIIKILLENGLIGIDLYSVIVASSIAFKFIVPVLFSNLLVRWGVSKK
ncbi:MAG: cation:proton antiporter [Candidatus Aenigmarchaeota archaeon]|nr:cation:proton antiporter [Candidatus Aenigmarchaeota archaeon]